MVERKKGEFVKLVESTDSYMVATVKLIEIVNAAYREFPDEINMDQTVREWFNKYFTGWIQ